jgi:hypothetical protein
MATNNSLNNSSKNNFTSPNFLAGYTTTATAAGTTTLTVSSNEQQYFTGSTTQTVVLPVASTLVLGQSFTIINNSTGVVTVNSSGSSLIQAMAASTALVVTCILTSGTTSSSWSVYYNLNAPSGSSTANIAGGVANQVLYQSATNTTAFLAVPSANQVLTSSSGSVPQWSTTIANTAVPIDGTTLTTCGSNIQASGSFTGGWSTAPVSSSTATTAFGASLTAGTALQNTTGYDLLVNVAASFTAATTATLILGVGSTSTPSTNTVIPSFTVAASTLYTFAAIVPSNYYLLVNSTGTITGLTLTIQSCPL